MSMMPRDKCYGKLISRTQFLGLRSKNTFCMRLCAINWPNVGREQRIPRAARLSEVEGPSLGARKARGGRARGRDVRLYGAVVERSLVLCPGPMPTLCLKRSVG